MAYSLEIRQKALAYYDKCKNIDLVIEAFGVSRHITLVDRCSRFLICTTVKAKKQPWSVKPPSMP